MFWAGGVSHGTSVCRDEAPGQKWCGSGCVDARRKACCPVHFCRMVSCLQVSLIPFTYQRANASSYSCRKGPMRIMGLSAHLASEYCPLATEHLCTFARRLVYECTRRVISRLTFATHHLRRPQLHQVRGLNMHFPGSDTSTSECDLYWPLSEQQLRLQTPAGSVASIDQRDAAR